MAPALTSHSFRLTAGGVYSKPAAAPTKPPKIKPSTVVYANRKDSSSSRDDNADAKPSNPFFIDFGKIPDAKSLIPVITSSSTPFFTTLRRKDPKTVFVAGATGQAGVRIVQKLLRQGFSVRAGVPELAAAQELARLAVEYKIISPDESKRLNAVESTFEDAESIARAIGPAAKAVVTVSAAENGPSAAVTAEDALQLLRAAQLAGVSHVALVFDESTSGPGGGGSSSYNVLDGITTFFSNLFSRSQTLSLTELLAKVAEETDVAYTFIKASLADDYSVGADLSLVISNDGAAAAATVSGTSTVSKVSRSQIAELVAEVLSNTPVTENKVFEVSTSSLASSKPIAELLRAIPEDGRRKAYAEAKAKATAAEEALIASEKTREAADAATKKVGADVKKLSKQQGRASSVAEEVAQGTGSSSIEGLLSKAKSFSGDFSWEKVSSQIATAVAQKPADEPRTQVVTVRGQAKAKSLTPQRAVVKKPAAPKQKPKQQAPAPKPEVKSVFGGLFKQETIYIDEV